MIVWILKISTLTINNSRTSAAMRFRLFYNGTSQSAAAAKILVNEIGHCTCIWLFTSKADDL